MMTQEEIREATRNMRNRTANLERAGDYWTEDEKSQLRELFERGVGLSEIAIRLQRTEPAVNQQTEKMDLYRRGSNPCRRKSEPKTPVCLCDTCELDKSACPRCGACDTTQEAE